MILTALKKDYHLILKHLKKNYGKVTPSDLLMTLSGLSLIGLGFASVIYRRDLSNEIIMKLSPLRYQSKECLWHFPGIYFEKLIENIRRKKKEN